MSKGTGKWTWNNSVLQLVPVRIEELLLFIFVQRAIRFWIGIGKGQAEVFGQALTKLPRHRRQQARLSAGLRADDRHDHRLELEHCPRDAQVAMGARQLMAGQTAGVQSIAVDGKPCRQKSLLRFLAQTGIAQ